ncbi:glycosyltransferase family 9 protein [Nakamurella endophytica]|uniref:LPS biosynthesis-related glycosyltransferase n=1 Tax=Nakamurella endophytica TaxID=1748367 RepID=A0A917WED2_9ACTN|nr:glycosyltransferase family 9 protein [Nakamurella endophytica]GGL99592.1 LPS biosynthesis-related glycosyltransferase [Nakamurella endophytica]
MTADLPVPGVRPAGARSAVDPAAPLPPGRRPLADPAVRTVALVRLRTGLGDLLASVPALRALRTARPDLAVTLVTYGEMAPVVARSAAYVDELLAFPGHPDIPERPAPAAAEVDRWFDQVRARRFDVAVQMYGALPAANEVTAALGARITAGFLTPGAAAGDLTTHLPYPFRAHEVDRHLRLLEFLGVPPAGRHLEFPLTAGEVAAARTVLTETGLTGGPLAVVHPGATAQSRLWPTGYFAAVADGLAERGFRVAITGVPSERPLVDAVRAAARSAPVDLCGCTDLGGAGAVLAAADVLVSNDTGVVQLAVALGTPSVTVYLAGDAARWRGAEADGHRAAMVDVGCNPCGLQRCPIDFRCAHWLTPAQVLAEVDLLPRRRPAPAG